MVLLETDYDCSFAVANYYFKISEKGVHRTTTTHERAEGEIITASVPRSMPRGISLTRSDSIAAAEQKREPNEWAHTNTRRLSCEFPTGGRLMTCGGPDSAGANSNRRRTNRKTFCFRQPLSSATDGPPFNRRRAGRRVGGIHRLDNFCEEWTNFTISLPSNTCSMQCADYI